MLGIRFAHTPATVLTESAKLAAQGTALYAPTTRARVAARLRHAVRAGLINPGEVQDALTGEGCADHGIDRLGRKLAQRVRALAPHVPRLPADKRAPFDPTYDNQDMRESLRTCAVEFIQAGIADAQAIRTALPKGGAAIAAALRDAALSYSRQRLAATLAACGLDSAAGQLAWGVIPALCVNAVTKEDRASVIMYCNDTQGCGFSATCMSMSDTAPGAVLLSRALDSFKLQALCIIAPHNVSSEGFLGSQLFADLEAYCSEAVGPDGTVTLRDDLVEHLDHEYGMDANDPNMRQTLIKALCFFHTSKGRFERFASPNRAAAALRAHAATSRNRAARKALESIATLLDLNAQLAKRARPVQAVAMDEDYFMVGAHVVMAPFTGFEERTIEDVHNENMNTGCGGDVRVSGDTGVAAFTLAVEESCLITVLDRLLLNYSKAVA